MHCTCINKNKSDQRGALGGESTLGVDGGALAHPESVEYVTGCVLTLSQGVFSHAPHSTALRLHGFRRFAAAVRSCHGAHCVCTCYSYRQGTVYGRTGTWGELRGNVIR